MSILDDVADWQIGGPLPAIRAEGGVLINGYGRTLYRAYVSDHLVGLSIYGPLTALAMADHSRNHWCDLPHSCPPVTYIRVDGEIGEDSDDPPSMTTWQEDLEEDRIHEEVRP